VALEPVELTIFCGIQTTVVRNPASAAGFDREKPQDRPPGTS